MMKRTIALILIILLFTGCTFTRTGMNEPVTFYYQRIHSDSDSYDDFFSDGIIGHEIREASGHRENLNYLLTVYLRGPLDSELSSPFPAGTRILTTHQEDNLMMLQLNPVLAEKSDLHVTIACACLAKTCMELADVDTVQIESRNLDDKLLFSRTFTKENLFLKDDYAQSVTNADNTQ